jgi:RimJ/RimL family protein N-acetyltransferase
MGHAASALGLPRLLAITTPDNDRSGRLLERLGFRLQQLQQLEPDGETLRLYACQLSHDAR